MSSDQVTPLLSGVNCKYCGGFLRLARYPAVDFSAKCEHCDRRGFYRPSEVIQTGRFARAS
jgi:hypothetical protein